MTETEATKEGLPLKARIHQVIFEADTPAGKFFDVALLLAILTSIVTVSLESVSSVDAAHHGTL